MNNRPGVAEGTRARILAAAEELGWRPSAHARALTEARARAIGLLLARPIAQLEIDPFFVRFLAGIERALARTDNALVLRVMDTAEPVDLGAYTRLAASGGWTVSLCDVELDDPRFDLLAAAGLPVVAGTRCRRARSRSWRPSTRAGWPRRSSTVGLGHRQSASSAASPATSSSRRA